MSDIQLGIRLTGDGKQLKAEIVSASNDVKDFGSTSVSAGNAAASSFTDLIGVAGRLGLTFVAIKAASAAAGKQIIEAGFSFNSAMEQANLGIATLISAQADLSDASGRTLTGHEALQAAISLSSDQMTKLRIAGLETAATTQQLAEAFQQAVGAGLQAGLSLDQIRTTTIGIVQAAGALGVPMNQLNQEVRSILSGTIDMNSRVGTALGITNQMVASWKAQGKLAEELNKRMAAFTVAGGEVAKTWEATKSNISEAASTFSGIVTSGMFDSLKKAANDALSGIFDTSAATISETMSGLADTMTSIFDRVGNILASHIDALVAGVKQVSEWLKSAKGQVAVLVSDFGSMAQQVGHLLRDVAGTAVEIGKWAIESGAVSAIFRTLGLMVAGLRDGIKLLGAGIANVGGYILDRLAEPLAKVMDMLGRAASAVGFDWGESLQKAASGIPALAANAHDYAQGVINDFANGKTAVNEFIQSLDNVAPIAGQRKAVTNQQSDISITPHAADDPNAAKAAAKAAKAAAKAAKEVENQRKQLERQFAQLDTSLMSQEERVDASYTKRKKIIDDAFAAGLIDQQRQHDLTAKLEQQHTLEIEKIHKQSHDRELKAEATFRANSLALQQSFSQIGQDASRINIDALTAQLAAFHASSIGFEKMTGMQKLSVAQGAMTAMAGLMSNHNRTMFEMGKVAAIGNAVVSTAQGAAKALEWGFPMGPIFAGIIVAAGAAQIAAISQAKMGSSTAIGASSPSFGGSGATPTVAVNPATGVPNSSASQPAPQQNVQLSMSLHFLDPSQVTPQALQQIGDSLAPAISDAFGRNAHLALQAA